MKQRLALGIVLLSDPKFIILDEPTNGLDPTGVRELRNLILDVAKSGTSVLFSSHQLGEIERVADRIICINHGELVPFKTNVTEHSNYTLLLEAVPKDIDQTVANINGVISANVEDDKLNFMVESSESFAEVIDTIVKQNVRVLDIKNNLVSIEDIYLEIFGE